MNTLLKTTFKKTFILPVFLLLLTTVGCSDDDKGGTNTPTKKGTLTCKINGEEHNFSYRVSANDPPSEDIIHFVTIGGHETDDLNSPGFGFQLVSEEGAAVGTTYSAPSSELHGNFYIQYLDSDGNITGTTNYSGNGYDGTSFTLNITSLNDWGVEGTFSGVLQLVPDGEFITVTDGKFSAPYNYQN